KSCGKDYLDAYVDLLLQNKDVYVVYAQNENILVPGEKRIGSVPPTADSAEDREQLAERWVQPIGKDLPDKGSLITVSSLSRLANYCCLSALFFVIGHDCAHKSFSQNKLVEDIVGTLAFLPLCSDRVNWHLNLRRASEVNRVKISLACVYAFMAVGVEWPTIIHKVGILGWMSTFTMVHHTPPHIPFKPADEWKWNVAKSSLTEMFIVIILILCHDINVHITHDMSPRIHNYNLCAAHESIQENWGKYTNWLLQLALVEDDNE
ncbi:LOW QUALITY PROTEIN: hypothetical protein HID58_018305, partial [Brassica napus]